MAVSTVWFEIWKIFIMDGNFMGLWGFRPPKNWLLLAIGFDEEWPVWRYCAFAWNLVRLGTLPVYLQVQISDVLMFVL